MPSLFYNCLFSVGLASIALFCYEMIQGRINRYSKWKDLTVDQWFLAIGSFCLPIGFFGMLAVKYS